MSGKLFTPDVLRKLKTREAQIRAGKQVTIANARKLREEMQKRKGQAA